MKKFVFVLSIMLAVLFLSGCSGSYSLDQKFTLSVGEAADIRGEDLKITFTEVKEDSRCPENVTCIWEGRAVSLLNIESGGWSQNIELEEPGLEDAPNSYSLGVYRLTYHLLPYPEDEGGIDPEDYRLSLTVSK